MKRGDGTVDSLGEVSLGQRQTDGTGLVGLNQCSQATPYFLNAADK
ncbi:uncharacterized protein METZ01_LOCUS195652, partial [marine metagenome]